MRRISKGKVGQVVKTTQKLLIAATVLALVAAACGGDGQDDVVDTSPPVSSTTSATEGVPLPPTTDASSTTSTSTTTTSTSTTTTTTAIAEPPSAAMAIVEAKTAAVAAALPPDWTFEIVPGDDNDDSDDIVFAPCVAPGGLDIDNIAQYSAAALQTEVVGPESGLFGPPEASIEARVFLSEALAAEALSTMSSIIGTDEGRECLTGAVTALFASDFPEDLTFDFRIEGLSIEGADAAARVVVIISFQGIEAEVFIDLAIAAQGSFSVLATYLSTTEPFSAELQATLLQAALLG